MTTRAGHGRLGLVTGRPFDEFIEDSAAEKRAFVELRGGRQVTSWALESGAMYAAPFSFVYEEIARDVSGVRVPQGAGLVRAETTAECEATPGSYYYDPDVAAAGNWDDGGFFDDGGVWDEYPFLYVHLADGSDPNDSTIIAEIGFYFGSIGVVHPVLGRDLLDGIGGFEDWTGGVPDDWSADENGAGWAVEKETVLYREGEAALRLAAGSATGDASVYADGLALVANARYRLSGEYRTSPRPTAEGYADAVRKAPGLLGYWRLGEDTGPTAVDASGNGHNATYNAYVGLGEIGALADGNTAIKGSAGGNASVSAGVSGPNPGDTIAVEWWFKGIDAASQYTLAGPSRIVFNSRGWALAKMGLAPNGGIFVRIDTSAGINQTKNFGVPLLKIWDGQWHHIVLVLNSGAYTWYHNGSRANSGTYNHGTGFAAAEGNFSVANFSSLVPDMWCDEVAVYSRELSAMEIAEHWALRTSEVPSGGADEIEAAIAVSDDGGDANAILSDGRTYGNGGVALPGTDGEWRRFAFDFAARGTSRLRLKASATGDRVGEMVRFDRVKLQRIWRWVYYEPRLAASSIPSVETGSNDIFFGGKRVGSGGLRLLNGDGRVERIFAQLDWVGAACHASHGGAFADGQEVLFDDVRRIFSGIVQGIGGTDAEISIEIQDSRVLFQANLPPDIYEYTRFGSLDPRLQGKPRPLWFGSVVNITPARIDVVTNDYGEYELADCTLAPNGIGSVAAVWAYLDETAANEQRTDKRVQLVESTDYTADLATARVTIVKDAQVLEITESNRRLDFSDGSTRVAEITLGVYTPRTLAVAVETAMNAVSSGITVSYSDATHKFTIAKGSGTLQLLINTGANKETAVWTLLGFARGANKTGSLSYTADSAIFTDSDKQHVLRVDGRGFKDDALGTYTGTPSAVIETGEAILRTLTRYLPPVTLDEVSLDEARARAPESLSLYLNESTSIKGIFDALEFSNIANIVLDGEGRLFYLVYMGDVPAGITDFYDRDFLEFDVTFGPTDCYSTITVRFGRDPTTGKYFARSASDPATSLRFNRPNSRPFDTLLVLEDNAQAAASRMLELARVPARKIRFSAKGKLVDKKVGDKIRVTRSRALDADGRLSAKVLRILSIRQDYQQGRSTVECVDDVVTVAGIACLSACQNVCETGCQVGCEVSCQTECMADCQAGCQTGCQVGCEVNCQQACELGCQTGTCESVCQACQACQTNCEANCQVGCEVACQEACEQSCETTCELGCQDTCELNCQVHCEHFCETGCQATCETFMQGPIP